ncbi:hypothetical protein IMAU80053_01492 [Lactiplantibacillus plantarum]|jgi:hypothetical protein|nr:hypothetical protein [Lactiplantibacillus plantarum]
MDKQLPEIGLVTTDGYDLTIEQATTNGFTMPTPGGPNEEEDDIGQV